MKVIFDVCHTDNAENFEGERSKCVIPKDSAYLVKVQLDGNAELIHFIKELLDKDKKLVYF